MAVRCTTRCAALVPVLGLLAGCAGDGPAVEPAAVVEEATLGGPADGYASRRWQEQTREAFRRLDRNRDGKLELDELRAGFAVLDADGDGRITRREAAQLVAAGDRDRDGSLSPSELAKLPAFRLESDRDGDGRVSALEFSLVRTDEFVRADADRDGRLAREEWAAETRFSLFRF
jgi:Ca2+-binding EF-hand superfamily protein